MREARAWGVEHLTVAERAAKALNAGADRFGGEQCPEVIVELVRSGRISEKRIDASVRRLLREKFVLGLFEKRWVDPDRAEETVGASEFTVLGDTAQRRSLTVLTNHSLPPLTDRPNLHVEGVGAQTASLYGNVVADPAHADVAVVRLRTPYEERPGFFESFFHSGSLAFGEERLKEILALLEAVPTLVCVSLERPAVLPDRREGRRPRRRPRGVRRGPARRRLRSGPGRGPAALRTAAFHGCGGGSRPDVPNDTEDPVFPYGHGLAL
ncbi:hypothetical protein ACFU53_24990 [Streptomyces sp. NPDC057474]|uniref:hypothetical protein n=1 Tax=Streptomyces sp. NPDC057474 TaxID=3346144 RepID=UPI003685843B